MPPEKLNCWEFMRCERAPGGEKAAEIGECPAATDTSFDGINCGKNAGRICWAVAGTCCGGKVQGTFAEKRSSCTGCDFYLTVQAEEGTSDYSHKFLNYFANDEKRPLLELMTCQLVKSGERFIHQGEIQNKAYIIQRGSCLLIVEKDQKLFPVGHLGRGDIVGERSVLTGEPQGAYAEAETDMELWVLEKSLFDDISKEDPELIDFLTEIVASRFDSRRPMADRVIGKYLASDIIGRGAFSIVYKGLNTALSMPVAIKMLRHNLAMDSGFIGGFRNEAKTIASLNHDNIIRVYDIEERFRTVFIIEELIEGESLKDLLARLRSIPPKLAVGYLIQICAGLEYGHNKGIIHRDINAANVFVQHNDRLKILDFGLACPIGTEDFASLGTVAYMAPEQITSEALDQRTDIYALGITAFEMVMGRRPFPEDDVKTLMDMHLNSDIPDPKKLRPNLPELLREFILKCCRRDPAERYQNITQALEVLNQLAEDLDLKTDNGSIEKLNRASFFLVYRGEQQQVLKQFMETIGAQAKSLGISLKSAEFFEELRP